MTDKPDFKTLKKNLGYRPRHAMDFVAPGERAAVMRLAEDYRRYLSGAKTERESTKFFVDFATDRGCANIESAGKSKMTTVAIPYRNKVFAVARLGKGSLADGLSVIATHHDSPRLDLKATPLYEQQGTALVKTHYFGGIRKHQWVTRPLAMHGEIIMGDGSAVHVNIGESEDDPVFSISDLLPHLSKKAQNSKKLEDAIPAEKLNVILGAMPIGPEGESERIKYGVLKILNERYGVVEEDFVSAELEIVPAGPARYVGLDRALIGGYGHDDRASSYAAVRALLDAKTSRKTQLVVCFDKEETGSFGNTGAQGRFLHYAVRRLFEVKKEKIEPDSVSMALHNSKALSADLAAAVDPNWSEVFDLRNAARIGYGLAIKKYTGQRGKVGASDASAELVGQIRKLFNDAKIPWQSTEMGKVDEGGGGTVAKFIASTGAEVLDVGPPVLAMHSPFELLHIADLYAAYRAYKTFLEKI